MAKQVPQKNIKLELTIDEVNEVLESLGRQPFMNVYRLIEKIHVQAKQQTAQQKSK